MAVQDSALDVYEKLNQEIQSHSPVVYCSRINENSSEWNTNYHKHDYLEIMYFIKGQALIRGKDSHSSLTANDLIIYPPGFEHKEYIDFSRHQEIVCIGIELKKSYVLSDVLTMSDVMRRLEWIFTEFHRQYELNESTVVRQLKYLLFSYLIQTARDGGIAIQPLTYRVEDYISKHFREHISQMELCELVNVSPSYLNRTFKSDKGQTPVEFINRYRVNEASVLLKKKYLTIEDVASQVGIKDPKYFSKLFKKVTGLSPREFRQSELLKEGIND